MTLNIRLKPQTLYWLEQESLRRGKTPQDVAAELLDQLLLNTKPVEIVPEVFPRPRYRDRHSINDLRRQLGQ